MSDGFPIPRQDGTPRPGGPAGHRDTGPAAPTTPGAPAMPGTPAAPGGATPVDPSEVAGSAPATPDPDASVVSWGDRAGGGRARRGLGRLTQDGRLLPVVAVLGVLAFVGSLVEEWTIVRLPTDGEVPNGTFELTSGVAQMATFGAAYLVGVLGVFGCLALVFFGTPGVRHNARVAGLTVAGAVLAVLAGGTGSLHAIVMDRWQVYGELQGLVTEYGRGLLLAYACVGILGLTLLLAGRFVPAPGGNRPNRTSSSGTTDAGQPEQSEQSAQQEQPDWPWHRPRRASRPDPVDDDRGGPIDLTVSPTKPFAR